MATMTKDDLQQAPLGTRVRVGGRVYRKLPAAGWRNTRQAAWVSDDGMEDRAAVSDLVGATPAQ